VVYTEDLQLRVGEWLRDNVDCPWTVEVTFDQISGLIGVLAEAQRNNVLHRHLSPQSIYWDENSQKVKLLDFSPCSLSTEDDRRFLQNLQPNYISPERKTLQWVFSTQSAAKADVYSLGVLALELIYGTNAADQTAAVLLAGLSEVQQLHSLLERMLRKDPRQRPDFIRLHSYLRGEPEAPVEEVKVPLRPPFKPPAPPGNPAFQANGGKGLVGIKCPSCGNPYRLDFEMKRGLCQACQQAGKGTPPARNTPSTLEKSVISPSPEAPKTLIPPKIGPKQLPQFAATKEVNPLTVQAAQAAHPTPVPASPRPLPQVTKLEFPPTEEKKVETAQGGGEKREEVPEKPVVQASQTSGKIGPKPFPGSAGPKPDPAKSQSRCKKCNNLFEAAPSPWRNQLAAQRPADVAQIQQYCSETCLPDSFKPPPAVTAQIPVAPPVPAKPSGFPPVSQPNPTPSTVPKAAPAMPVGQEASEPMIPGGQRTGELFAGNPELQRLLSGRLGGNPGVPGAAQGFPAGGQPGGFPGGLAGLGLGSGFPQGEVPGMGQGFPQGVPGRGRGQNPGVKSKCIVCMREFQAPRPPHEEYSAYFLSFCGEECQLQYFSLMGDENTLTQALQGESSCMQCRVSLEEGSGVILPCNACHKFCSDSCGKFFIDSVFSGAAEGNRDLNFLLCPRCETPIPIELAQCWLPVQASPFPVQPRPFPVQARPFPAPASAPASAPGIVCDGCENRGEAKLTTCVHWLCQQCAANGKTAGGGVRCPKCNKEVNFQ